MRLLVVPLLFVASQATAQELVDWSQSGDWAIRVDPTNGNGCLAERLYEDGTLIRAGIEPTKNGGFFAAYNEAWTAIEEGVTFTIRFDFERSLFEGEAVGEYWNDIPGVYAFYDNPAFVTAFTDLLVMRVAAEGGGDGIEVSLKGTMKARDAVLECQDAQPEVEAAATEEAPADSQ